MLDKFFNIIIELNHRFSLVFSDKEIIIFHPRSGILCNLATDTLGLNIVQIKSHGLKERKCGFGFPLSPMLSTGYITRPCLFKVTSGIVAF